MSVEFPLNFIYIGLVLNTGVGTPPNFVKRVKNWNFVGYSFRNSEFKMFFPYTPIFFVVHGTVYCYYRVLVLN